MVLGQAPRPRLRAKLARRWFLSNWRMRAQPVFECGINPRLPALAGGFKGIHDFRRQADGGGNLGCCLGTAHGSARSAGLDVCWRVRCSKHPSLGLIHRAQSCFFKGLHLRIRRVLRWMSHRISPSVSTRTRGEGCQTWSWRRPAAEPVHH